MSTLKQKIKHTISSFFWDAEDTIFRILQEEDYLQKKISFFNYFILRHKRVFFLFIHSIPVPQDSEHDRLVQIVKDYFSAEHPKQTENTRNCIFRILYDMQICTKVVFDEMFKLAKNTENKETRYWITQSIETIAFHNTLTLPNSYYLERKELFKTICTENNIKAPLKQSKLNRTKKSICILTYLMDSTLKNSSQRVLKMIIDNLDHSFFDIHVLCIDSFYSKKINILNYTNWSFSYKKRKKISTLMENEIDIQYCTEVSPLKRIQESINKIYELSPDFILDMTDEYSIGSYIYSKDFMTMYFPLRGKITASYCTHYRTSTAAETLKQNEYYLNPLSDTKLIEWSFPEYVPKQNAVYTRAQFSFKDDDFIIASAGIIPSDDEDFFNTMIEILDSDSRYVWLIIGSSIPLKLKTKIESYLAKKRIIDWGYENELAALYKICNVFITPDKTGGSGTVAIAAQQKLPVIISTFPSDALRWIKEENCIQDGYKGFKTEINRLSEDANYYRKKSDLFYNLAVKASDSKEKWSKFNSIIKELIKDGRQDKKSSD